MMNKIALERERGNKIFNFRPFLFGAIFFAFGVIFSFYHHFRGLHIAWILCLLPIAVFPLLFCANAKQWLKAGYAVLALCVCFLIGFYGFFIQVDRYQRTDGGKDCYISGRVIEMRERYEEVGLVLDDLSINGKERNCKLIAYLPASFSYNLQLSDWVFLNGDVEKISIAKDGFGKQAKDFGEGIYLVSKNPDGRKTEHDFDLFLALNTRAKQVIEAGMDKTTAAVTKGVLLGDTTGIESGLYNNIRYGGIAHIFAVSGLHVGSLFAFCLLLVEKSGLKRMPSVLKFVFTGCVLFMYAGICAFTASVVRASIMCLMGYLYKLIQIKSDLLQSLGLSALVIMVFDPSALFTIGFQLSFAACFGIAFLAKPIGHVFDELAKTYRHFFPMKLTAAEIEAIENDDTPPPRLTRRAYRAVSSFLSVSLGAQIFTAPFLLYYFGYVSGWALILNCIFVPFISGVFSLLLLMVVLACILPASCSIVLLYVPNVLWSAVLLLFEVMDFSTFAVRGYNISISVSILYIMGVSFCTDKWNVSKWTKMCLASVCICAFVIGMVALNV